MPVIRRSGIYAALLACVVGCGPAELPEHSVTRVEFTVDTVATYTLEGRSLVDPDVLGDPDDIVVASSDRLLVVDDKAEKPLLVFDRFSGDLLKSAGAFGSGPGEVSGHSKLDVKTGKSEGWVLDIIYQSLTYVHLDTLVATGFLSHRSTRFGNSGGVVLNSAQMADGSILGWGVHPVEGLAMFDSSGAFEGAFGNAPPGADNVSMAIRNHAWRQTLRTSPDAERLVAAYYNADRLDIYDSGVLTHIVNGPEFFEPVYIADETPRGQMLALQPDNRSGYVDVEVTEEFIYALYSGKKRDETSLGTERGAYFLVFDWTGRPMGRLNVSGSPSFMTVSADNSELYVIFKSPVPQIIRYEIPKSLVQ